MIDFNLLKKIITDHNSFLLTTHVNPDADAIGSEIVLYTILRNIHKKVYIVNHSSTPYNLGFLDKGGKIEKYNPEIHNTFFNDVDVLVGLDFNRSDRIVSMREEFLKSGKLKIIIDHHMDTENFVNHSFVDADYCATGHILYDFIKQTGIVKLDYELAYPLYAAIMTDTGSFRFDRTTAQIHMITAEFIELNVIPGEVYDKIYDQSKFSKMRLLGKALNSMNLAADNQICYMVLTQEDFKFYDALESDTDSFVNFSLAVENVKIGILFIELKEGFKVSFRSKGTTPVNRLASEFGGGGHTNAAGMRMPKAILDEYIPIILKRAKEYL